MQLTDDFWSHVDKTDECWNWKNVYGPTGYGRVPIAGGKSVAAHRLSWEMANGQKIPQGMLIDHICHNHACVRPEHLRLATPKQNLENLSGLFSSNKSGYRGVCWNKKYGWWQATVVHNYQRHFLGYFHTAEEAGLAAQAKRLELYTHNDLDKPAGEGLKTMPKRFHQCTASTLAGARCSFRVRTEGDQCNRHVSTRLGSDNG
jgi:hypothetical protein